MVIEEEYLIGNVLREVKFQAIEIPERGAIGKKEMNTAKL